MESLQTFEGGCRCRAVRYRLSVPQLPRTYACHCLDCQTWSGSAFAEAMIVPEAALAVTGEVAVYELTGPSGYVSRQRMCPVCHARVFNTNSSRPGLVIRAGTLDDSHLLNVVAHIWTKRKQPWLVIAEGVPAWPEMAPAADFMAALGFAA